MLSMATGSGKTSVANAYIGQHERGSLVLWLAPACELLDQAEINTRRVSPHRNRFRIGLENTLPDIAELPLRIIPGISATVYATLQLFARRIAGQQRSQVSGGIP